MAEPHPWIVPQWDAPARVGAVITTRAGGYGRAPFDTLNLGLHVGDDPATVARNRTRLRAALPNEPCWLKQVHGTGVVEARAGLAEAEGDASVARDAGVVCAVMVADCLPVLLCDRLGRVVAAAHAGWRGLAAGVLEATVQGMQVAPSELLAFLGPAIGPTAFEVGDEVRQAFLAVDQAAAAAFVARPRDADHARAPRKWLANIYELAARRLRASGVTRVYGGGDCTYRDSGRFFSYRRDGTTGRMAAAIWLKSG
ncbi:MAG: peptidoglycan editing factor PgeF [Betaproteobacteria bacterium]|nr:peptidoglycan editing factor PgeF [Betaproteobacteria bacterium]